MLKFRWPAFPGVQALLMKGLTLDSLADTTRSLLSHITPHSTQRVFDPSQYAGLALNIMALMPVLVHHFSGPTPFCRSAVDNILLVCNHCHTVQYIAITLCSYSSLVCSAWHITSVQCIAHYYVVYSAWHITSVQCMTHY